MPVCECACVCLCSISPEKVFSCNISLEFKLEFSNDRSTEQRQQFKRTASSEANMEFSGHFIQATAVWSPGFESLPPPMFKGNILSKDKLAD